MAPGERLLAVLVADMSRSTEQRALLGDQQADDVRRIFEWIFADVVEQSGGAVVAGLGDGAMASFDRASASLEAAVALQQRVERHNIRLGRDQQIHLRVGVGAGDAATSDDRLVGFAAAKATELCDRTRPSTILASTASLELAGSRFRADRPIELVPGDGAAVVGWTPLPSMSRLLGLPDALAVVGQLPFAGRSEPIELLRREIDDADGALLLAVGGEPGVGKTRLAAELCRSLYERDESVLYGRSPSDVARPYRPFVNMFQRWLEVDPSARRAVAPYRDAVARLLPELAEGGRDEIGDEVDVDAERSRMYEGAVRWLEALTDFGPTTMVIDDAHYARPSTLELLGHLLRALRGAKFRVLLLHRTVDGVVDERLATWLARENATEMVLEPLDRADVAELIVPLGFDPMTVDTVYATTGGNPLYVGEVVRNLEEGVDEGLSLPDSVRAAIDVRTGRLPTDARTALQAASVLGGHFDIAVLRPMVVDIDVIDAIDVLVAKGLIEALDEPGLNYRFAHGLVRESARESMSPARRAGWHERAALALAADARGAPAGDVARHYLGAIDLGYHIEALTHTERAARSALGAFADHEAEDLYSTALRVADGLPELPIEQRCRLLIGRGEALRRIGSPEHRSVLSTAAALAEDVGDGSLLARAILAGYIGTFRGAVSVDEELLGRIDMALELPLSDGLRARLLAVAAVETAWHPQRGHRAAALSDQGLALARTLDSPATLAEVLARRHWVVFHPMGERVETTAELRELSRELGDPVLEFEAALSSVFTAHRLGDRSGRDDALVELIEVSERLGQPPMRWLASMWRATTLLIDGHLDDAALEIDTGHRLGTDIEFVDADLQRVTHRFWVSFERTALDAERVERLSMMLAVPEAAMSWPPFAHRCAEDGFEAEAAALARECWASDRFLEPTSQQVWLWNLCHLARAAAATDDLDAASRLLPVLAPHRAEHAVMVFSSAGSIYRYTGLLAAVLGDRATAVADLLEARDRNEAAGAVGWALRTELDLYELGESDRPTLERVGAAAADRGLGAIAARAERLGRSG